MAKTVADPVHPGEILRVEFLEELGLTPYRVAKACGVPRTRIERLCREKIGVTADTALRLERCFGASARFWLDLQSRYDLDAVRPKLADALALIEPLHVPEPVTQPEGGSGAAGSATARVRGGFVKHQPLAKVGGISGEMSGIDVRDQSGRSVEGRGKPKRRRPSKGAA